MCGAQQSSLGKATQTPHLQVLKSMVGRGGGEDIEQPNDLIDKRSPNINLESVCLARETQVTALHQHIREH